MERIHGQIPQGSAFMTDKSEPVPDPEPLSWMFKCQGEVNLFGSDHLPSSTMLDALRVVVEIEHDASLKKGQGPVTRTQEKGY